MKVIIQAVGELIDLPGHISGEILELRSVPVSPIDSFGFYECDRTQLEAVIKAKFKGYFLVSDFKAIALEGSKVFLLFDWEKFESGLAFSDYYDCVY